MIGSTEMNNKTGMFLLRIIFFGICFSWNAFASGAEALDSQQAHEKLQWADFSDKVIEFSGYRWRMKSGGLYGPGNNYFSDSAENVWVDQKGWLHLRITRREDRWYCPEIVLEKTLGYGDYIFRTVGRVDDLDPNLILGFFLWEYQESYEGANQNNVANEFDIEFGTWKDPNRVPGQFICQPWNKNGNESHFQIKLRSNSSKTSHAFLWSPDAMNCRSWHGFSEQPFPSEIIHAWSYQGSDLPKGSPRIHINFWCIEEPPSDLKEHEIIVAEFRFVPRDVTFRPSPSDLSQN
jgi:hypothetical protein